MQGNDAKVQACLVAIYSLPAGQRRSRRTERTTCIARCMRVPTRCRRRRDLFALTMPFILRTLPAFA